MLRTKANQQSVIFDLNASETEKSSLRNLN